MGPLIGVDGCTAGWIAASRDANGVVSCRRADTLAALFAGSPAPRVVAVDIPIGLLARGARECDVEARRLLQARRSSVFPAPLRPMLAARSHADASRIRRRIEGKGVSIQAWMITPKIVEVDRFLLADPRRRRVVHEVHPELAFCYLNGGRPMRFAKKTRDGQADRLALLRKHYGDAVDAALETRPMLRCHADDIVDAFAVLWSAERIARGDAVSIPAVRTLDAHGLPMTITA